MGEGPYKCRVVGLCSGDVVDERTGAVVSESNHKDDAYAIAHMMNKAHAHATAAAARRVRELEDREGILLEALEACRVNDRSVAYEYGEKRKLDEAAPPKGKRWNTPFEISRDAIGEWAKAVFGAVGVQSLKQALAGKERTDGDS